MHRIRQYVQTYPLLAAAVLTTVVMLPALLVWLEQYATRLSRLTIYELFPLLGLTAFTCMLAHVVVGTVGALSRLDMRRLQRYYRYTSYVVLASILLHPGLFIWQLYHDGYGLPPGSYLDYVESSLRVFVLFGTISLVIFLLFELKRKYGGAAWWHYVERASDAALVLVFVHGLFLGSSIQSGWFRVVWMLYGVVLLACLGYGFWQRRTNATHIK